MGSIYLCGSDEQKRALAAGDGPHGADRRLRADRARGRLGDLAGAWPPPPAATATTGSSTARRSGSATPPSPTSRDLGPRRRRRPGQGLRRREGHRRGSRPTSRRTRSPCGSCRTPRSTCDDVRVPEANRLQQADIFRATADVLRMTRTGVAWQAAGCARGAYEHALRYTKRARAVRPADRVVPAGPGPAGQDARQRHRLDRPERRAPRSSRTPAWPRDEHASLAKAYCTVRMRETVGWAREVLGGNGILLEHHVGRFVADAEAIYSYEGTREINTLIVGRAITGRRLRLIIPRPAPRSAPPTRRATPGRRTVRRSTGSPSRSCRRGTRRCWRRGRPCRRCSG